MKEWIHVEEMRKMWNNFFRLFSSTQMLKKNHTYWEIYFIPLLLEILLYTFQHYSSFILLHFHFHFFFLARDAFLFFEKKWHLCFSYFKFR